MTDFKAAIFDMDGTLLDSMWVWLEVDRKFLEGRGLPNLPFAGTVLLIRRKC